MLQKTGKNSPVEGTVVEIYHSLRIWLDLGFLNHQQCCRYNLANSAIATFFGDGEKVDPFKAYTDLQIGGMKRSLER